MSRGAASRAARGRGRRATLSPGSPRWSPRRSPTVSPTRPRRARGGCAGAARPGGGGRRADRASSASATTVSWLDTANAQHGGRFSPSLLALFALAVSVPLLLRNRFPAQAWWPPRARWPGLRWPSGRGRCLPTAYLPGGVLVYVLCLYAVAVRCQAWFVVTAAAVTVLGAVLIEPRHRCGRHPGRDPGAGRGHRPVPAGQPGRLARRPAGTRGSARCSRSASASPGNCTTSSPTTCP